MVAKVVPSSVAREINAAAIKQLYAEHGLSTQSLTSELIKELSKAVATQSTKEIKLGDLKTPALRLR